MPKKNKKPVAKKATKKPIAEKKPVAKKEVKEKSVKTNSNKNVVSKVRAFEYHDRANAIVKPYKSNFALVYFIYAFIIGALGAIAYAFTYFDTLQYDEFSDTYFGNLGGTMLSSSLSLVFSVLTAGAISFAFIQMAKHAREHKCPVASDLFSGFKKNYAHALATQLVKNLFLILWTLLFIIPGIIKSYSYALAMKIAYDHPEKSPLDCITESRKLMNGNKWKSFCLQFSYIGWVLLVILTLGILSFWVMPKMNQAFYEFYLHTAHKDNK